MLQPVLKDTSRLLWLATHHSCSFALPAPPPARPVTAVRTIAPAVLRAIFWTHQETATPTAHLPVLTMSITLVGIAHPVVTPALDQPPTAASPADPLCNSTLAVAWLPVLLATIPQLPTSASLASLPVRLAVWLLLTALPVLVTYCCRLPMTSLPASLFVVAATTSALLLLLVNPVVSTVWLALDLQPHSALLVPQAAIFPLVLACPAAPQEL